MKPIGQTQLEPAAFTGRLGGWWLLLLLALFCPRGLWANPVGPMPVAGSVTAVATGPNLQVQVSDRAILNWRSFDIAPGETTTFLQPSASSVVWNQINSLDASKIYGSLQANGLVVLANPAGFYFGPSAFVKAAGFVATTATAPPPDWGSSSTWSFTGAPPQAKIVNYGSLEAADGGSLFLIAHEVENHGSLTAPGGTIGLCAGQSVLLCERADGRGLSAQVQLPDGVVNNQGRLVADAGKIALEAQVVNQNGLIQANSVRNHNGVIELVAGSEVNLGPQSVLKAQGGDQGPSDGGSVTIQSQSAYHDQAGSQIRVDGSLAGGNGGHVELSAPLLGSLASIVSGGAVPGWRGGGLLLDPDTITLTDSSGVAAQSGKIGAGDPPDQLSLDVNSFSSFSQIVLQARTDILLNTLWNLAPANQPGSQLTLQAGRDIRVANNAGLLAGQGWSVQWFAGADFVSPASVQSGKGGIYFAGNSFLETADGDVRLKAGNEITVASGYVRTDAGGNLEAIALAGNANTGARADGFLFSPAGSGYAPSPNLGGLSTAAGGNVTITAGQNIISFLPTLSGGAQGDGGSGAFGPEPGNVTLTAGANVFGHYVLCNGIGQITVGGAAGQANRPLALSLVKGSWTVDAADIGLQEVRNPNGIFNRVGISTTPTKHLFDYDPDAAVTLEAKDAVQLLGLALPRNSNEAILPIYPPDLSISAGAGGVTLANQVTLFTSPRGQLSITTTDGGALQSRTAGTQVALVMSDSDKRRLALTPGELGPTDHAATPLHLDDSRPFQLNIAGNVQDLLLVSPKQAQLQVGGELINSSFVGQNLHPTDVTSLTVAGRIWNRNDFTFANLDQAPDFTLLNNAWPPIEGVTFSYSDQTHRIAFKGRMTSDELQALLQLQVITTDVFGNPVLDRNNNYVTQPAQFLKPAVLQQLYAGSQDVPDRTEGYQVGGPGKFKISAGSMDLGVTKGIVSYGPQANPSLAKYSASGADIQVHVAGDLTMFSSAIESISGGGIQVNVGGSVNVGSAEVVGASDVARGIFTSTPNDVSVVAQGDIQVNGSRIAAYDGGTVTVRSERGNVDAGSGGLGFVRVQQVVVDPVTLAVTTVTQPIPGSGILAATFPEFAGALGNIVVETPRGDIRASSGGIVQVALNAAGRLTGDVDLRAGSKDSSGQVLYAGSIDAGNSGVIGSTIHLDATGDIRGVVFARENIAISALQNVSVTALAQGNVSVQAGGTISGSVIGVSGVSASGASVDAAVLSQNVSTSGNLSSSQVGFAATQVAAGVSQHVQSEDTTKPLAAANPDQDDEAKRRAAAKPAITRSVGRVTVILPN